VPSFCAMMKVGGSSCGFRSTAAVSSIICLHYSMSCSILLSARQICIRNSCLPLEAISRPLTLSYSRIFLRIKYPTVRPLQTSDGHPMLYGIGERYDDLAMAKRPNALQFRNGFSRVVGSCALHSPRTLEDMRNRKGVRPVAIRSEYRVEA
jgi:hypothetical protein